MTRKPRCRAKNPSLCIDPACPEKRGYVGPQAPRASGVQTKSTRPVVKESPQQVVAAKREQNAAELIKEANNLPQAQPVAMKDLDTRGLAKAIMRVVHKDLSRQEQMDLARSIHWADDLHRGTDRKNPVHRSDGTYQPTSPYIMHPLRNTLRLALMGVRDNNILLGSVLHDTVEDEAPKMSGLSEEADIHEQRVGALKAVAKEYNDEVRELVESVSNPIIVGYMEKDERNRRYTAHVEEGAMASVGTFLIKVSDFIDNALSLHHNSSGAHINKSRAVKYAKVVPVFQRAMAHHDTALRQMLNEDGLRRLRERLDSADSYLSQWN